MASRDSRQWMEGNDVTIVPDRELYASSMPGFPGPAPKPGEDPEPEQDPEPEENEPAFRSL